VDIILLMNIIDKMCLKELEENCGGSCITIPNNCKCFKDKELDFKTKECCPHFDNMTYEVLQEFNDFKLNVVKGLMKYVSIKEEEIIKIFDSYVNDGVSSFRGIALGTGLTCLGIVDEANKLSNNFVYVIHTEHGYKIGKSSNVKNRINALSTIMPFEINKVDCFSVKNMNEAERYLHKKYNPKRKKGEWFDLLDCDLKNIYKILEAKYEGKRINQD